MDSTNAFARYGLAMELSSRGEHEASLAEFAKLLEANPDYTPGYFMYAQTLALLGRTDTAKEQLRAGIASATRTGNTHAHGEMSDLLAQLGG